MQPLPIGVSDFKKIRVEHYHFVDKSVFVKDIIQNPSEVILITRPRRFGKTINLSMLYHYLTNAIEEQPHHLFHDLLIGQDTAFAKNHYHQYPTIFLTFKGLKSLTFDDFLMAIKTLMSDVYDKYGSILLSAERLTEKEKNVVHAIIHKIADTAELGNAIRNLIYYFYKIYGKKSILLIDEYDAPIHSAYINGYYPQMIDLMGGLLGEALKDSAFLEKGVLTGIARVAQASIFSGLNNFKSCSVLDKKYSQYFGFTEQEVHALLLTAHANTAANDIKDWYNGYHIGENTIYNPWSILNCLYEDLNLKPYWINTSDNTIIQNLISNAKPAIKSALTALMQGETLHLPIRENVVFQDLDKNEEAIWALLLYSGYLTLKSQKRNGRRLIAELYIPNLEVMLIYDEVIEHWFSFGSLSLDEYDHFISSLVSGDLKTFEHILSDYITQSGSYFDFHVNTKEQVFHSLILGLVLGLRENYTIKSNQESGYGRFDVVLIPKDKNHRGILLEFKTTACEDALDKVAASALEQIESKKYTTVLTEQGIHNILLIGMAFCGKNLKLLSKMI
jgi:hypothetical protein